MGKNLRVLAIDDDVTQLKLLEVICQSVTYPVVELVTASRAEDAYPIIRDETIDLVLTDYRLPGDTGLDVLRRVKELNPLVPVVVVTAFGSTEDAIEVMKNGADDYLLKPVRRLDIEHLLVRTAEQLTTRREDEELKAQVAEQFDPHFIVYRSRKMTEMLNIAARSARSSAIVLIRGESGTGKELVAQLIHHTSDRRDKPFVTVNVAALPETLVESELFGHRKGAFTGATEDRVGRFADADSGTLFIDEVGDISPTVQVKLLRAIQFKQVQRLGDNKPVTFDGRIIAATHRDLEAMIEHNEFRADLYYRLDVVSLRIPPLRERKEDIPELVDHFIERFNAKNGKSVAGTSREALDRLMKYDYPGNVRELENIVERAVILARGELVAVRDLPQSVTGSTDSSLDERTPGGASIGPVNSPEAALDLLPATGIQGLLEHYERELILAALRRTSGNQSAASRLLRIGERRLRSRLEVLRIENEFR